MGEDGPGPQGTAAATTSVVRPVPTPTPHIALTNP
jgi:hypothetical protein